MYETGSFLTSSDEQVKSNDVIETTNHFRAIDYVIDHASEPLTETMLKDIHRILKRGTAQELSKSFNVGGYKTQPNGFMGMAKTVATIAPADIKKQMDLVLQAYAELADNPYDIAELHWQFERIHPFSDGNGRVGRLIMFKELLRIDAMPIIIEDSKKNYYYRGLQNFPEEPGYLVDTLLDGRDTFRRQLRFFTVNAGARRNADMTASDRHSWDGTISESTLKRKQAFLHELDAAQKTLDDSLADA
jgi:Fic family protein